LINSGRIELLDHNRLVAQLGALERRTGPSGRDTVTHARSASAHDDVANSVAGVAALVMNSAALGKLDHEILRMNSSAPSVFAAKASDFYGGGSAGSSRGLDLGFGGGANVDPLRDAYGR
jgi:hypothetical protein